VVRARQRYFVRQIRKRRHEPAAHRFFGYSEVGYECLSLLLERGDNVVALITHEDNPAEKIWFKTPAVAPARRASRSSPRKA